jgi:hypothetical protein
VNKGGEEMITQDLKDGGSVSFTNNGSVVFMLPDDSMTAAQFAEFMPLALLVYHRSMPMLGGCAQPGWSEIGSVNKPAKKKPGRPKKVATAKPGRPRKA